MTHDIPRFGTPDGGLTWASTGTHHGGPVLMALAMAGQFPPAPEVPVDELLTRTADEPLTALVGIDPNMTAGNTPEEHLARLRAGDEVFEERDRLRAEVAQLRAERDEARTPRCTVCEDTGVCDVCRGGSTADIRCWSCSSSGRCGYCNDSPCYLDGADGLTWAEQVAARDAEIERLRGLVRTVDLCGTGYVWRDRTTGKEHMLNPIDVDVLIGAEHQTQFERLHAERDAARAERDTLRARVAELRELLGLTWALYEVWWHTIGTYDPGHELISDGTKLTDIASLISFDDSTLMEHASLAIEAREQEIREALLPDGGGTDDR